MKKLFVAIASVAMITGIYSFTPKKEKAQGPIYIVDVTKSKVDWSGSAADHYHPGYFTLKNGQVSVDGGKITGGKFVIDLSSVKVTDGAAQLEGHLKSKDFFDVAALGEATYEISSVTYTDATNATIDGKLTLKGITVPVKFTSQIRGVSDTKLFAEATFSIDRTLWGITYGQGKVNNDVQVAVHLFATK
ncbi:YceI family protein [Chitinophagaceae bacterium LWZ2-11]